MKNYALIITIILLYSTQISSVLISSTEDNIQRKIISNFLNSPKKELFKVYHFLYKKNYDINSEEAISRYNIFKSNLKYINEMNSKNLSFKLGIGPFTDMTHEEYVSRYISQKKEVINEEFLSNAAYVEKDYIKGENSIDHREFLRKPLNQGLCSASYAFSTLATIEGNYNKNFGKKLELSHQELLACDDLNYGCIQGDYVKSYEYIRKNGIAHEEQYPYKAGDLREIGDCQNDLTIRNKIVKKFQVYVPGKCSRKNIVGLLLSGVVSVMIDAKNEVFMHYQSGLIDMPCSNPNYSVNLVGMDSNESGDFYIVRNSMGEDWGEDGYFRILLRDSDKTCFIESEAIVPVLVENDIPIPVPPKTCVLIYESSYYSGKFNEVCENTSSYKGRISSLKLGKFNKLLLFEDPNCRRKPEVFESDKESLDFKYIWDEERSMIMYQDGVAPPQGCIWLYKNTCFTGDKVEVCANQPDLTTLKFLNETTSFRFGPGVAGITVYTKTNFLGKKTKYNSEVYNLEFEAKKIQSITITPK